jgi:small GTP-binding protein
MNTIILNKVDKTETEDEQEYQTPSRINEFISNFDYMFRICIVGDANVGKTSLLTRYCDNVFRDIYCNTIGVDFRVVTLRFGDSVTKVHIWDTAGQERFKSITVNYFRSAHGFIFVYDVTNKNSFKNLSTWFEMALGCNKNTEVNFLVGNKTDMPERAVSQEEATELAMHNKFNYLETSALTNDNVNRLFEFFGYKLVEYYSKNKRAYDGCQTQGRVTLDAADLSYQLLTTKKKKFCC